MADIADEESLKSIAYRLRHLLKTCLEMNDEPQNTVKPALINEYQRFDIWGRNLGVYQRGHASLDYRFRDAPLVYSFARRLLLDLEQSLMTRESSFMFTSCPRKSSVRSFSWSGYCADVLRCWKCKRPWQAILAMKTLYRLTRSTKRTFHIHPKHRRAQCLYEIEMFI